MLRAARVIVVVAGMDGALPSVVAGLVSAPVVAVPTSVGYGAAFEGLAPLLAMLNACAPGVAVVNIDNGYGAGHLAAQIAAPLTAAFARRGQPGPGSRCVRGGGRRPPSRPPMRWYASGAALQARGLPASAERLRRRHRARQQLAYRLAPFGREPRDVVELRGRVDDHAVAVRDLHRDRYALDADVDPAAVQRPAVDHRLADADRAGEREHPVAEARRGVRSPSTESVLAGRPFFMRIGVSHASAAPASRRAASTTARTRGSRSSTLASMTTIRRASSGAAPVDGRRPRARRWAPRRVARTRPTPELTTSNGGSEP